MPSKSHATGLRQCFANVPVVVNKPHDRHLKEHNWNILSEDETTTTFEYSCANSYAGDDESVVDSLYRDLPENFDRIGKKTDKVKIDWINGIY